MSVARQAHSCAHFWLATFLLASYHRCIMSYFDSPENLKLLKNLFEQAATDESAGTDSPSQLKASTSNQATDSTEPPPATYSGAYAKLDEPSTTPHPSNIEEWENAEQQLFGSSLTGLKTPDYRISYKQAVSPEDIFLRTGNKTAATASCEEMCLDIELPDETMHIDQMQLDVHPLEVELQTAVYHLKLPLVQRIDVDRSKASWLAERKTLRLLLRMKREYDFINF